MSYRSLSPRAGDKHLAQWDGRTLANEIATLDNRSILSTFERMVPAGPEVRVLEAGCGLGAFVDYFVRRGNTVFGIEGEPEIVAAAEQQSPGLPVQHGDVERLEVCADDSLDVYVSLGVIEHFEEGPAQALREAHRVLKPEGLAFVTVPYNNLARRLGAHRLRSAYFLVRRLRGRPGFFWEYRYSRRELCRLLENAGFRIVAVEHDDFSRSDRYRHLGLHADYPFLRSRDVGYLELNRVGRGIAAVAKRLSPWLTSSGVLVVARKVVRP